MAWVFNSFRLDPDRFDLIHGSVPVRIEPQVLVLLIHLIRNRDRMVTKDEIAQRVWTRRTVADASISSAIRAARAAVGDDGSSQTVIRARASPTSCAATAFRADHIWDQPPRPNPPSPHPPHKPR